MYKMKKKIFFRHENLLPQEAVELLFPAQSSFVLNAQIFLAASSFAAALSVSDFLQLNKK